MQSFKLTNKEKEQKHLEQQKKAYEDARNDKNLNTFEKNNETTSALVLGIIAVIVMFIPKGGFISIILVIFAARKLMRAKKIGESKKYINITYVIVYLPVIVWLLGSLAFAFLTTK